MLVRILPCHNVIHNVYYTATCIIIAKRCKSEKHEQHQKLHQFQASKNPVITKLPQGDKSQEVEEFFVRKQNDTG